MFVFDQNGKLLNSGERIGTEREFGRTAKWRNGFRQRESSLNRRRKTGANPGPGGSELGRE